ncbi:Branched-chain amino acid transport ATP-binding protein LivF [Caenispirillum salinarum AK4]|uniref:Branched-chain amino acid transport ATP-binding protein LivF n=1 Tax=Caenispirillum salinarum AK4 TaxID=1238182 RepID=K9HWX9_9PROT|nr:ABC transporter ATP-binding protein [Caenispirillum salinarum]EKV32646.1 Branched-chain amino acid transport ATP-binding protein LivF [Caenispirillum salinarum AK4]
MLIEARDLSAGYGDVRVLEDISLGVAEGEIVALLGRNGMGKTTTVRALTGMLPAMGGSVLMNGTDVTALPSHKRATRGLGLVPEGRRIFPNLTVAENLRATERPGRWTYAGVLELFPRLGERLGNLGSQLSGGEQQMLAIGRALLTNPSILILDEATEGLAPVIRAEIWQTLARLKDEGQAILLVDSRLGPVLRLADRAVVLVKGRIAWEGATATLRADEDLQRKYLAV